MSAVDWSTLPSEFAYLRAVAAQYGSNYAFDMRQRAFDEVSDEELAELARVARLMRRPGELDRLWEWRQRNRGSEAEERVKWLIQFVHEVIPVMPDEPALANWADLPGELGYLREPAVRYGPCWLGTERERLIRETPPDEFLALLAVARRALRPEELAKINDWLAAFPPSAKSPASVLVHHLVDLFDELSLAAQGDS